jgi:D-3-phosphoglycerate dehydrogenase / 2-oxoglutarate reductase
MVFMANWKVIITDGLEEAGQAILRQVAQVDSREGISPDELLKVIGDYDAIIIRSRTKVNAAVFAAASKLKIVGRAGIGLDNIDLNSAKEHKVTVVNAPIATTNTVAELSIGMMLALARELPRADASMKAGKWIKKELEGVELFGKTLGVIGFGRIGAATARLAKAFDMKILGYDPLVPVDEIKKRGGEPVALDALLSQADFITFHLPLTNDSRGMLNAAAFSKMKKGVRIVCAARGGIIDEAALLDALNSGQVAGAALDVFATEPPGATALVTHPKVVATPHIGAQTGEAQARAGVDIASEVVAGLQGKVLRWKCA